MARRPTHGKFIYTLNNHSNLNKITCLPALYHLCLGCDLACGQPLVHGPFLWLRSMPMSLQKDVNPDPADHVEI